jgi:hypothetical protein
MAEAVSLPPAAAEAATTRRGTDADDADAEASAGATPVISPLLRRAVATLLQPAAIPGGRGIAAIVVVRLVGRASVRENDAWSRLGGGRLKGDGDGDSFFSPASIAFCLESIGLRVRSGAYSCRASVWEE